MSDEKTQNETLLSLMQKVIEADSELREKFEMGNKFRFIRDRLVALQDTIAANLARLSTNAEKKLRIIAQDEIPVYIYLYNAQGLVFKTWQKMLKPSVFYEYSVNRPIYISQSEIEAFIRSKETKNQHAYLTLFIKKTDILISAESGKIKDALGHSLVKVREGALKLEMLSAFTHMNQQYELDEAGELVKKE